VEGLRAALLLRRGRLTLGRVEGGVRPGKVDLAGSEVRDSLTRATATVGDLRPRALRGVLLDPCVDRVLLRGRTGRGQRARLAWAAPPTAPATTAVVATGRTAGRNTKRSSQQTGNNAGSVEHHHLSPSSIGVHSGR